MTITETQPIVELQLTKDEAWRFFRAAKFAAQHASTDSPRHVITTIKVDVFHDEPKVRFSGTDSYKLAVVEATFLTDTPPMNEDISVLVDAKQLLNVLPTKSKINELVTVVIEPAGMTIQNGTTNFLPGDEDKYPNIAGLMTPWINRLESTEIFAVNPHHMAKIFASFKQIGTGSDKPVRVISQDRMRPIGFEMDLELLNVKSLLMPVRIP